MPPSRHRGSAGLSPKRSRSVANRKPKRSRRRSSSRRNGTTYRPLRSKRTFQKYGSTSDELQQQWETETYTKYRNDVKPQSWADTRRLNDNDRVVPKSNLYTGEFVRNRPEQVLKLPQDYYSDKDRSFFLLNNEEMSLKKLFPDGGHRMQTSQFPAIVLKTALIKYKYMTEGDDLHVSFADFTRRDTPDRYGYQTQEWRALREQERSKK